MKSSHLVTIAVILATIGLSLPARADQVSTDDSVQTAIITGSNNSVNQSNLTINSDRSRGDSGNRGTSTRNRQTADIQGDDNSVTQSNETHVENNYRRYR